jgi:outer membrane immunogenic protein
MRKITIALTVTTVVGFPFAASAADLSVKAAPVAAPTYNWTGCYVGVNAGAGVLNSTWSDGNGVGALAGGQVGCNYQTGMLVAGIEGEGFWSGMQSSSNYAYPSDDGYYENYKAKNTWDFDIAARFGLAFFDRALIYGKAGVVWGKFDYSGIASYTTDPGDTYTYSANANQIGLLIGMGLEYAFAPNWSAKFEWDYLGYQAKTINVNYVDEGTPEPYSESNSNTKQIFKLGLNYKIF